MYKICGIDLLEAIYREPYDLPTQIINKLEECIEYSQRTNLTPKGSIDVNELSITLPYCFCDKDKSDAIIIYNNGLSITQKTFSYFTSHCFINLKMNDGIYHVRFSHEYKKGSYVVFCACKHFGGLKGAVYCNTESYSFGFTNSGKAYKYELGNKNDLSSYIPKAKNKNIYEFIFNTIDRKITLRINGSEEYELFRKVSFPLYPAIDIQQNCIIQILSITNEYFPLMKD